MREDHNYRLRNVLISVVTIFGFCVLVLFSWNSFAPDLFQLPEMKFKQAVGLVVFTGSVLLLARLALAGGNNHWRKSHGYKASHS